MLRVYRYMYTYIYIHIHCLHVYRYTMAFRVKLLESDNMMKRYWRYCTPWVAEGFWGESVGFRAS